MRNVRGWSLPLYIAGFLQVGMGLYHFVLPIHMDWAHGIGQLPASISWALYALNASWSLIVLTVATVILFAARSGPHDTSFGRHAVFVIGLFWLAHGVYIWRNPMPLPNRLAWLRVALAIFPATLVTLHWLPLMMTRGKLVRDTAVLGHD
jgi:hypothetical protein